MNNRIGAELFSKIFSENRPLLDVRAPLEFRRGAFPKSTNIPLLDNQQRQQVGQCYKLHGQAEAIKLGHQLISGELKEQRIAQWSDYILQHPDAFLYCFRGGMRSQLVQQWLAEKGYEIPIISGGYKALRSFLLNSVAQPLTFIRLSGATGVGKTELLQKFSTKIDLEGLAHHRGSAFGAFLTPQPTQINFENNLAIHIIRFNLHNLTIIIEDESHYIGSLNVPPQFYQNMLRSPVVVLTEKKSDRIQRIYADYVKNKRHKFIQKYHRKGEMHFANFLLDALLKIKKRLGGVRYQYVYDVMQRALQKNDETLHKQWIDYLLTEYYDPMYDFQINKKKAKIIFTGDKQQVNAFLSTQIQ